MLPALTKEHQKPFSALRGIPTSPYALLLSRIILGGVFLAAGASKVFDPGSLAAAIRSYDLGLPEWFVSFSAHLLPYLEVMLGVYLTFGLFTRVSAWTTNVLMLVFTLALAQAAARGLEISCGCFGGTASEPSNLWLDAARDVGLFALGLHVALLSAGRFSVDAMLHRGRSGRQAREA